MPKLPMHNRTRYQARLVKPTIAVGAVLVFAMIVLRYWRASMDATSGVADSVQPLLCQTENSAPRHFDVTALSRQQSLDSLRDGITNFVVTMQAVMDRADDEHLSEKQKEDLQMFVAGLDSADVSEAVQILQEILLSNPTAAGRNLQIQLLGRWTELNPLQALAWANVTLSGRSRERYLNHMAGTWATSDLPNAVAWARQLPQGAERDGVLTRMADKGAATDPVGALTLVSTLPASSSRDELVANAVGQWASKSPIDAAAWATRIPDETEKAKVTSAIAIEWANSDPVRAARLAVGSLPPGQLQILTTLAIVERFAQSDMDGATAWVTQFPEGDLRASAQESLREVSERTKMLERLRAN